MRTAVWKLTPARHKCENNKKGNNKTKKSSVRTAVKSYKERARKRTRSREIDSKSLCQRDGDHFKTSGKQSGYY